MQALSPLEYSCRVLIELIIACLIKVILIVELEPSDLIYDSTVPCRSISINLQVVYESICIIRWLCWLSLVILHQFNVVFDDILAEIWHCKTLLPS